MFLTQIYKERVNRKIKEAEAKGKAEGKAEGIAEERELWVEWNNLRLEAEAKGEEFTEPPPTGMDTPSE